MLTSSPTPYPPTGSTLNDTGKLDVTVTPGLQFSNVTVSNPNVPPRVPYVRLFEVTWPVKAMSSQVARPPNAIGLNLPTPGVPTSWVNAEAAGATARTSATATAAAPSRFIVMTLPGWDSLCDREGATCCPQRVDPRADSSITVGGDAAAPVRGVARRHVTRFLMLTRLPLAKWIPTAAPLSGRRHAVPPVIRPRSDCGSTSRGSSCFEVKPLGEEQEDLDLPQLDRRPSASWG